MGIASSVLEAVRGEARRHPGARVCKVGLRIGEWASVDPDALQFCFDALLAGSEPEPPTLDIEFRPRQNRCATCGTVFALKNYEIQCPDCGEPSTEAVSGNELELAYVELEEP
ncbi:MAG TPA: hydrogenase maturation nickel metallochaperone HypA [Bryobacteraceae bacterium]|nr:hydrogenase maturation nickel metallochaperone HypA [Bryobacteraceae bacterium]